MTHGKHVKHVMYCHTCNDSVYTEHQSPLHKQFMKEHMHHKFTVYTPHTCNGDMMAHVAGIPYGWIKHYEEISRDN